MTYYLSLHNFCLFTSAIYFNVVNPSNNTFNRKKIIITIFVNETKCIFEKNYKKKPLQKWLQVWLQKLTPNSTPKKYSRYDDICVLQRIEHLGEGGMYQIVAPKSTVERNPNLSPIKPLLVHRCITHIWIYTSMVGQTRMANESRKSELLWYYCNI